MSGFPPAGAGSTPRAARRGDFPTRRPVPRSHHERAVKGRCRGASEARAATCFPAAERAWLAPVNYRLTNSSWSEPRTGSPRLSPPTEEFEPYPAPPARGVLTGQLLNHPVHAPRVCFNFFGEARGTRARLAPPGGDKGNFAWSEPGTLSRRRAVQEADRSACLARTPATSPLYSLMVRAWHRSAQHPTCRPPKI